MGMKRRAPLWLTWLLTAGLLLLFLGERVLAGLPLVRLVLSLTGALVVLGCLAWRIVSWRLARASGSPDEVRVEKWLTLAYAGCVVALLLYFVSSETGMRALGIYFDDDVARARYRVSLQVLWPILLAVSLFPALGAQLALGARWLVRKDPLAGLETVRVGETATSGLVIALAGSFLFLLGYLASAHDVSADLGYFRTSSPGTATQAIAQSLREPLRVLLFFPDPNPVKDEVMDYFHALARSGARIQIEAHDRLAEPELAKQYGIGQDGTVVLVSGEGGQRIHLPVRFDQARSRLRRLDREVQEKLIVLSRGPRVAYFTVGHGELNDSASAGPLAAAGLGRVEALRDLFRFLNYDVRELGLAQGLGHEVPEDATMVLVLGPRRPFLPEELDALDRYLERGGSMLLALEPESEFQLGPLEKRLGVRFRPAVLADDYQHLRRRGNVSDRALIITDRFSAHSSISTASVAGPGAAALFIGAGSLERADTTGPQPSFIIQSLPSTFADLDGDFELDEKEQRNSYNLAAAVELDSARALVYADAEMFADAVLVSLGLNASLAADGIRWLGREERLSGTTESEEDVPIQHTKAENVAWFYSTILGAPTLVLVGGLIGVYRRRRRGGRS